mgnify:CR=1 FL=1
MKYITKKQVLEEGEKYGIFITNRQLQYYKDIQLIHRVAYGLYEEDTPKLFFVLRRIRKIPFPIKMQQIKFYIDLLQLTDEKWQKIEYLQREDRIIEEYISLRGITEKIIDKLKIFYSGIFYETLLSRLFVFSEILCFRAQIEIWDHLQNLRDGKSRRDTVLLKNIEENPALDIDEKKREIIVRFDSPIDRKVTFTEKKIKVE